MKLFNENGKKNKKFKDLKKEMIEDKELDEVNLEEVKSGFNHITEEEDTKLEENEKILK